MRVVAEADVTRRHEDRAILIEVDESLLFGVEPRILDLDNARAMSRGARWSGTAGSIRWLDSATFEGNLPTFPRIIEPD